MAIIGHASSGASDPDSIFKSEAVSKNDIPRSIAGRARVAYELAAGENPFPNEPPAAPLNPQGNVGHDHSGPPFGSAFLHPVVWWTWQKLDATNLQQPGNPLDSIGVAVKQQTAPFVFWNRPHSKLPIESGRIAPYSRLFLYVVAHHKGSTSNLGIRLQVLDATSGLLSDELDTISVASATPTGFVTAAFANVFPGRNICRLQFTPATFSLSVTAWALCQTRKRAHASGVEDV